MRRPEKVAGRKKRGLGQILANLYHQLEKTVLPLAKKS